MKELGEAGRVRLLRTRALQPLEKAFPNLSAREITVLASRTIAHLSLASFAHSIEQSFVVCDVYALRYEQRGFYVKLYLDIERTGEELVVCMSFHLLERPLMTNGGEVKP